MEKPDLTKEDKYKETIQKPPMDKLSVLAMLKEFVPTTEAIPVSYSKLLKDTQLEDEDLSKILISLEKERYIDTWNIGKNEFKMRLREKSPDVEHGSDLGQEKK